MLTNETKARLEAVAVKVPKVESLPRKIPEKTLRKRTHKKKKYGAEKKRRSRGRKTPYKNKRAATPAKKKSAGTAIVNITNLDRAVTEADVKEIFSKIGKVKKAVVMYNAKGQSRGVALVTFANAGSAAKAVREYHQAEVDGRPMYVKAVSYNARPATPQKKKATKKKTTKKKTTKKKTPTKKKGKKSTKKKSTKKKGGKGKGKGKQSTKKKGGKKGKKKFKKQKPKTVEELDQEMEDYYNKGTAAAAEEKADPPAKKTVDPIAAGQPDTAKLFSSDGAEE